MIFSKVIFNCIINTVFTPKLKLSATDIGEGNWTQHSDPCHKLVENGYRLDGKIFALRRKWTVFALFVKRFSLVT